MSGDFPTSTLQVTGETCQITAARAGTCQEQAGWRRPGLQLVDEDVWDPNVGGGYRHLLDFVEVFWVPHQELICPRLEHSDPIIHNLPTTFGAITPFNPVSPACTTRMWSKPDFSHPVGTEQSRETPHLLQNAPTVAGQTHHVEDGVDHEVDGHGGGRAPVLDWSDPLFIASAQELRQTHQSGVPESPRAAARLLHCKRNSLQIKLQI